LLQQRLSQREGQRGTVSHAAPSVEALLSTLPKARLVDLGKQFGVAIAKPNGVPITESVERLVESKQLVFTELLEWMRRDELRKACKKFGLDDKERSRAALAGALIKAHGAQSVPPVSIFGDVGPQRSVPEPGDVALVRQRQYLVESVAKPKDATELTRVDLVCLDDDQQGRQLSVLWELELGAKVSNRHRPLEGFASIDPPRHFAAYLHAVKWNSVTATEAGLFQSPFRAGIRLMNHQLTPLKKALELPRCNLFIADDVGLGKTIEAGLVMQELQLRQRVQFILIVCPASICLQWQREMERRFGQRFEIYDREFVSRRRRERGFGVNPWVSHQRFIVSYHTLKRPEHMEPLLQHLGKRLKKSLLVLDEAHTAAPSSPGQYAYDSNLTKLVRQVAPLFENRLFLSATPHNGHSNSFSTLLELLDPQRFTRGVPVEAGSKALEEVMVRRLKRDLLGASLGDFPTRHIVRVALRTQGEVLEARFGDEPAAQLRSLDENGLPELQLAQLLAEYTELMCPARGPGRFVFVNLQKRLLSSVAAFHRTLHAHLDRLRKNFGADVLDEPARAGAGASAGNPSSHVDEAEGARAVDADAFAPIASDDVEARDADEDELDRRTDAEAEWSTSALRRPSARARQLLGEMLRVADAARHQPDAKARALVHWIRQNHCPGVGFGQSKLAVGAGPWSAQRLIVFTEYADTKRYLTDLLQGAIENTTQSEQRILGFHGAMSDEQRERVQDAFNGDPDKYPVRILIATDAAREGLNLQNHCCNLFHFDVPWNPARLEQRNGRIDRTLQPSKDVWCHYFVYADRREDAVLDTLVKKVETIQRELGTLSDVVMQRMERALALGIQTDTGAVLDAAERPTAREQATQVELESQRMTVDRLKRETDEAGKIRERSAKLMRFNERLLRDAVNVGLELATGGDSSLRPLDRAALDEQGLDPSAEVYALPELPPSWERTLDSLRPPRAKDEPEWQWRKRPLQPVVFKPLKRIGEDRVHLHLEHPVVQRLLSRFLSQGYSSHDLSRVTIVPNDRDGLVRVIAFGRISLFGRGASRLHDEVISVAAQRLDARGEGHLRPFADEADRRAITTLEDLLADPAQLEAIPEHVQKQVLKSAAADFAALWPAVKADAEARAHDAKQKLTQRGQQEARALRSIIEAQRQRIHKAQQLTFNFDNPTAEETSQLESERRHMNERLKAIGEELEREPRELEALYDVVLERLEPVGLVYLWPTTRL
jgi:hypothetical protein